jgi:hypothetical protein
MDAGAHRRAGDRGEFRDPRRGSGFYWKIGRQVSRAMGRRVKLNCNSGSLPGFDQ